jgi:hypothetical protein
MKTGWRLQEEAARMERERLQREKDEANAEVERELMAVEDRAMRDLVVVEAELEAMREEEAAQRAVEEELARTERLDRRMELLLDSLVTNAIGEQGDLS